MILIEEIAPQYDFIPNQIAGGQLWVRLLEPSRLTVEETLKTLDSTLSEKRADSKSFEKKNNLVWRKAGIFFE